MSFCEGYFAKINDYPDTELKVCVSRKFPHFVKRNRMDWFPDLGPTPELLDLWKKGKITWEEFEKEYLRGSHHNLLFQFDFNRLLELSRISKRPIRLMCFEKAEDRHCHRFILLSLLEGKE